ncbi:MAG TPA: signal peptidase II [Candidatus Limnocylindrales bacterium]|nr:signal peptidase II [Candidatus Limnocylindrales bacterium]
MTEVLARGAGARVQWASFGAVAAAVIVADQLSKRWIDASFGLAWTSGPLPGYAAPTPVLGDLVRIAKSYNDGGIFGLFGSSAPILALASLAVIGFIVAYEVRVARSGPWLLSIALGLLLGGALGNLADRLRLGYVVDFVDVGLGGLRFYTFNVADSAISVAIVALLVIGLLGERLGLHEGQA